MPQQKHAGVHKPLHSNELSSFKTNSQRHKELEGLLDEAHSDYKQRSCLCGLWEEITLIDEDIDKHRQMTWSELFYDLIFVTAVGRIGEQLKAGSFSPWTYCLYLLTVFGFWHSATAFGCRFHRGDFSQKLYFGLHMIAMVATTMAIPNSYCPSDEKNCSRVAPQLPTFALCAAFIHFVEVLGHSRLMLRYWRTPPAWYERETKYRLMVQSIKRNVEHMLPLAAWVLLGYHVIPGQYALWCFLLDIVSRTDNFIIWTVFRLLQPVFGIPERLFVKFGLMQLHVDHYAERLGLVILIMLGESVDGIAVSGSFNISLICTSGFAYIVIFGFKLLYFDCMIVEGESHLLTKGSHQTVLSEDLSLPEGTRSERVLAPPLMGSLWICSHQFLAVSVAMMGDALAVIAVHEEQKDLIAHPLDIWDPLRGVVPEHAAGFMALSQTPSHPVHLHKIGVPVARTILCICVGVSQMLIGYIGLSHEHPTLSPKNPDRGTFVFLFWIQLVTITVCAIASICLVWVPEDDFSNINLLGFFSGCSLVISALFYVDECVAFEVGFEPPEEEELYEEEDETPQTTPAQDYATALVTALDAWKSSETAQQLMQLCKGRGNNVSPEVLAAMIAQLEPPRHENVSSGGCAPCK